MCDEAVVLMTVLACGLPAFIVPHHGRCGQRRPSPKPRVQQRVCHDPRPAQVRKATRIESSTSCQTRPEPAAEAAARAARQQLERLPATWSTPELKAIALAVHPGLRRTIARYDPSRSEEHT